VAEEAWTLNQSRLLTQLAADEFSDLERHIFEAVLEGKTPRQVARELESRLAISKRRLEFIVENEVENFNAAITKKRQQDLGIESYRWSTSGDQRVRATHRALDNRVFRWDDPPNIPGEGPLHPGQPIRCRCVAQAVIDGKVPPPEYKDERSLDEAIRGGTASWGDPTRTAV
jgi:SPP1 gp7 family putative phage head morphogenesis protein